MRFYFVPGLIVVALLVSLPVFAGTVTDNVAGVAFSTEPQTVEPGAISAILTIETQDGAGSATPLGETGDLIFTSSSDTGEFVNESGSPVSTTMNRNSSRRNFYYRDSTAGTHTLTVTLTGRTSQRSWTAVQDIGVGQAAPGGQQNIEVESGGSSVTTEKKSSSSPSVPLRVEIVKVPPLTTNAPFNFKAKVSGGKKTELGGLVVHWAFGDGAEALGLNVIHEYQFAGKYIVVVTAELAGEEVLTRTTIEVGEPSIEIGEIGYEPVPHLQLINKTSKEIDLGTWRLGANSRSLLLPANTMLAPNAKLIVPVSPEKLPLNTAAAITLTAPTGRVVATKGGAALPSLPTQSQPAAAAKLQANLDHLVAQVDTLARREWAAKQASKAVALTPEPASAVVAEVKPEAVVTPVAPAVLELPKKESVLERGWQRVKSVFSTKK